MPLFGERLRAERERLGLGQQELAAKCDVTMRSQRNYEKGERQPDAAYLAALTALGGDVLYVLTGHGSKLPMSATLPPDEQLLLDAYRGLTAAARKALLAELLTAGTKKKASRPKPTEESASVKVRGFGNRTAGRDYHEKE